jgi:hypothetical protein
VRRAGTREKREKRKKKKEEEEEERKEETNEMDIRRLQHWRTLPFRIHLAVSDPTVARSNYKSPPLVINIIGIRNLTGRSAFVSGADLTYKSENRERPVIATDIRATSEALKPAI